MVHSYSSNETTGWLFPPSKPYDHWWSPRHSQAEPMPQNGGPNGIASDWVGLGNLWKKSMENLWKCWENLEKSMEKCRMFGWFWRICVWIWRIFWWWRMIKLDDFGGFLMVFGRMIFGYVWMNFGIKIVIRHHQNLEPTWRDENDQPVPVI